jgi:uncharacterized membrane protein YfcA
MPADVIAVHSPLLRGLLLFVAGAVASGLNTVGGGGSLVTFPTLVALGVPVLTANATNSAALWPGSLGSALGLIKPLRASVSALPKLLLPTVVGAVVGALLLLVGGEQVFRWAVPPLILLSTALLAFQPALRKLSHQGRHISPWLGMLLQLGIAIYGGYFGAGMGILMLALFGLFVDGDIHAHNAVKAWLGLVINLVASAVLLAKGLVDVPAALWVSAGAIVGGYLTARVMQRIAPQRLRRLVVVLGVLLCAWFFARALSL